MCVGRPSSDDTRERGLIQPSILQAELEVQYNWWRARHSFQSAHDRHVFVFCRNFNTWLTHLKVRPASLANTCSLSLSRALYVCVYVR